MTPKVQAREQNILDLVLTNVEHQVHDISEESALSDHKALSFSINFNTFNIFNNNRNKFNFHKADFNKIRKNILNFNFEHCSSLNPVVK